MIDAETDPGVLYVTNFSCFSTRNFQLWNLAIVAVLFCELLDPPSANLEPLDNHAGVHIVFNNTQTYWITEYACAVVYTVLVQEQS